MKTKLHYEFLETKILATRHKQHCEFHYEFRPWDGCQMVNTSFSFIFWFNSGLKIYHETNTNKICSFKFIYI